VNEGNDLMSQEDWCTEIALSCPQLYVVSIMLQLEIEVMIYV
jgi:hypothetical protein